MGIRIALAALGAVLLCRLFQMPYTLYALVSVMFVTELTVKDTWTQAVNRTIGNGFGALTGSLLCSVLGSNLFVFCAVIIITTVFCSYLGLNPPATKLSSFVAALIVLAHSDTPWLYGRDRFLETLVGIFMAVLVSVLIPHQEPKKPAEKEIVE